MHDADSIEIRELLWSNLQDPIADVRGEALVGLASRQDERVVPVLMGLLDANCRVYELQAAEFIASPALLPRLKVLEKLAIGEDATDSYWLHHLLDAIDACCDRHERPQ